MNHIDKIFDRCNIESICEFLMSGGELVKLNSDGYREREKKAENKLREWLHKQFPDSEESDEHLCFINAVLGEIQSIYLQIGLQAGIMLAAEFNDKNKKL